MIAAAIIISLQITAIYLLFQQGMLLGWFRIRVANGFDKIFGNKWSRIIQKPLWDCLTCMAGIWTVVLTQKINIPLILMVCALNAIIDKILSYEGSIGG